MTKPKVIAFYLPQYHPIKENNEWFGEGFTEWTSVGKAKPLFKGHYQPHVPADLGYYDLRVPEVREKQAELAKYAGIDAFCYYHYYFGNGRRLMEMPIEEVVRTGKPDFPFCLCWANHSFYKKAWNSDINILDQTLLIQQEYPGEEDIKNHFYTLLHIFKDKRYYTIEGKPVFVIYDIKSIPDPQSFINIWNTLAKKEGLKGFYFISHCAKLELVKKKPYTITNGIILNLLNTVIDFSKSSKIAYNWSRIKNLLGYFIKKSFFITDFEKNKFKLLDESLKEDNIIPCIYPNWDNSPRRGGGGSIFINTSPKVYKELLIESIKLIKDKPLDKQIIFIKSWNEWGEGNYLEPDIKYGKGFIEVMHQVLFGQNK